jgi:GT2 family glycosyltransferase
VSRLPLCSIVVATRGRPVELAACLEALARLDYPSERFEVIVVDDGGEIPLGPLVERLGGQLRVSLLERPPRGMAAALNDGADRAKGELLAFLDDDCVPEPGWLRALATRFAARPEAAVGGRTLNGRPDDRYASVGELIVQVGYDWHNADPDDARFFASNNLAFPTAGFRELGGFDSGFARSSDRDLCDRWVAGGFRMTYAPEAVVRHAPTLTFRGFCRKHFANGRGVLRFHRSHAGRGLGPVRPRPRYYAQLVRRAARGEAGPERFRSVGLVLLSQAATYTGYAWEWLTPGRRLKSPRTGDGAACGRESS